MADQLSRLTELGVSIWLDDISRERLTSGNLAALVRDKHVVGVTSNPTIFEKAITHGTAYDDQLRDIALRGLEIGEAMRALTTYDIRWACDVLRPAYDASDGKDGRVSIEVDPRLAHETDQTIAEARALWWLVDRPNLFVKIPATVSGLPAIAQCLSEGISINVTLIFSLERYEAVMEAFLSGIEQRVDKDQSLTGLESVASFFVSRVDTEVDHRLDVLTKESEDQTVIDRAKKLRGEAAIANARLAYERFEKVFSSERWQRLAAAGAHPQRPLWASTSTKDPAYDDTRYVDNLVASNTVNTMPEETLHAVEDHGNITGDTVRSHYDDARAVLAKLEELGISYDDVVDTLEREGVEKFAHSWESVYGSVEEQLTQLRGKHNPGRPGSSPV